MKKQAYFWTREHSCERLELIERVHWTWEHLFDEPGDRGHYMRFQWRGTRGAIHAACGPCDVFDASIAGTAYKVHLRVVTLKEWFAREVFKRAQERTRARYPHYDEHTFMDGPRVGERVLLFLREEYELAWQHLWTSLRLVIEDEQPHVAEMMSSDPCNNWGYPAALAATYRFGGALQDNHRLVTVVRNRPEITPADVQAIKDELARGQALVLDPTPVTFSFGEIESGLVELSAPELAILNWEDARKPLSAADRTLHSAVSKLDHAAMEAALATGADVNSLDDYGNTVLENLICAWDYWDETRYDAHDTHAAMARERQTLAMLDTLLKAGAHPDLCSPNEAPPIVTAAIKHSEPIVRRLLAAGANAAVRWASDDHAGCWPQTWDNPVFDAFCDNKPEALPVYHCLLLNRPSPYYTQEQENKEHAEALQAAVRQAVDGEPKE